MNLISKKIAGFLLLAGLLTILIIHLFFIQSIILSLAFITSLILIIIFLYSPKWGLFIFLFIRPALDQLSEEIKVQLFSNYSLNGANTIGIVLIILSFLFLVKNRKLFPKTIVFFFWIIYITVASISIFYSIDKFASLHEVIRIISILSIFLTTFVIAKQEKNYLNLLWAVMVSAIFPVSIALYQLITGSGMSSSGIDSRLFGTFTNPNSFAAFVLIIIALTIFFILQKTKNKGWLFAFLFLLNSILLATFSRGAWLAMIIFAFFLSLWKSPKYIFAIIGILLVLFFTSNDFQNKVEDVYNPPITGSVYWRFKQWDKMLGLYKKQPLAGYGAGTETIIHEKEFGFYAGNPYTHNDLLRPALETGIFGAISFLLVFLSATLVILKDFYKNKNSTKKTLAFIILVLLIAEFAFGMTSNIFRGTAIQWTLWSLIAVAIAVNQKK